MDLFYLFLTAGFIAASAALVFRFAKLERKQ